MMKAVLGAAAAVLLSGAPALAEDVVPGQVEYNLTYEISLNLTFSAPDQVEMTVHQASIAVDVVDGAWVPASGGGYNITLNSGQPDPDATYADIGEAFEYNVGESDGYGGAQDWRPVGEVSFHLPAGY
ncbi:hypothetical protein [Maricaulis maris]|uniref:hypothetical protein n=1 Tax=Maricaulis maris TaxID=74318 RepID=UPI003B8D9E75